MAVPLSAGLQTVPTRLRRSINDQTDTDGLGRQLDSITWSILITVPDATNLLGSWRTLAFCRPSLAQVQGCICFSFASFNKDAFASFIQIAASLVMTSPAIRPRGNAARSVFYSVMRWPSLHAKKESPWPSLPMGRRRVLVPYAVHSMRIHLPTAVLPPLIFTGLFLTLWCWKCTMLILFQNAIIYNPFIPPNARSMRISDFAGQCRGINWREERIRSLDGTSIALCVGETSSRGLVKFGRDQGIIHVYILYFQGNASSLPPRLPDISSILRRLEETDQVLHFTTVGLSYRGYWTSHDRPSERGINLDGQAALQWISRCHQEMTATTDSSSTSMVVLWGQSIGCGFATNLAALPKQASNLSIDALVLETPFTNTRAMLKALYPQRWLPYQHLWPFLRNQLDSLENLNTIATMHRPRPPQVYIVDAARDELVPQDHGRMLHRRCLDLGIMAERSAIRGALHNDVMVRKDGKQAIAQAILTAVARAGRATESPGPCMQNPS
ncbi:hypothetical protein HIM_03258 [Hirsutella minnesotensis 3608]|nr:hypothetical protein HIM_03258 [Hirsutella minnesotensis 3608]